MEKLKTLTKQQHEQLKKYQKHEDFVPRTVEKSSVPCKCICTWILAVCEYLNVYVQVKPIQDALEVLEERLRIMEEQI